jgi:hypothetical protein
MEETEMIRARFYVNDTDPRPVVWPITHPYWVTGYTDGYTIIVAYADDTAEILRLWPDATEIESTNETLYYFSKRFPWPEWLPT